MREQTIFHVVKDKNYVTIHSLLLKDPNISGLAKALLAYFMSFECHWDIHLNVVQRDFKEGIKVIRKAVNELIAAGYIIRYQERSTGSTFGKWITKVFESKELCELYKTGSPKRPPGEFIGFSANYTQVNNFSPEGISPEAQSGRSVNGHLIKINHETTLNPELIKSMNNKEVISTAEPARVTPIPTLLKKKTSTGKLFGYKQQDVQKDVWEVFTYWVATCGYMATRTLLTKERRLLIEDALEAYGLDTCKLAIDGCSKSPYHNGQGDNKSGKCHKDLELILRDAKHIEDFAKLGIELKPRVKTSSPSTAPYRPKEEDTPEQRAINLAEKEKFLSRNKRRTPGGPTAIGAILERLL